jgi:hypothetical protein
MTYVGDKTWTILSSEATAASTNLRESLLHAKEAYEEYIHFAAGRTNAQIATALAVTEQQVADLAACFQAFLELHSCATNLPIAQGDRMFGMRKFS